VASGVWIKRIHSVFSPPGVEFVYESFESNSIRNIYRFGRVCAHLIFSHGHHCFIFAGQFWPLTTSYRSILANSCFRVDSMSDSQRSALVTGATSGIGRATAKKLISDGWTVFAAGRLQQQLETLATECEQLPGRLVLVATDVSDNASIDALFSTVEAA